LAKTLIIGAATNYTWEHLAPWVNSINESGFGGDAVVVATNITKGTIEKLNEEGINVSTYGRSDGEGGFIQVESVMAPHIERFFWIWNYLNTTKVDYDYVVVTDTRDVIFQKNPESFMEIYCKVRPIIACSEGLTVENEPWNWENINQTFGKFFAETLKDTLILNVGVIAGRKDYVKDLMIMIFQMGLNRPIKIVDQAVFNFLINQEPYKSNTYRATNSDAWAAQLGATIYALEAGSGDLGQFGNKEKYLKDYIGPQPKFVNGEVVNHEGRPFFIVHQYDRVPDLKRIVEQKYGA
jgi:hypothetical protein